MLNLKIKIIEPVIETENTKSYAGEMEHLSKYLNNDTIQDLINMLFNRAL